MNRKLIVASVTRQGARHALTGRPNEDSAYLELIPHERGLVAAVSDGAGSASRAKAGSHLAATYAVKRAVQAIVAEKAPPSHAVQVGLRTARETIKRQAAIIPKSTMSEYDCTLILVAWVDDQVAAAQVGDGAVIVEQDGIYKMLTVPGRGEYANETFFLTESHFPKTLFTKETNRVTAVALFTDGLQNYAVDFQNRRANANFMALVIASLRSAAVDRRQPKPASLLPEKVAAQGLISGTDNRTTDQPQVGNQLFHWIQQQVGHTADDMSLIAAATFDDE